MSKVLSISQQRKRRFLKNLKSFENKLHGSDVLWWKSLSFAAKLTLTSKWTSYKKRFLKLNKKEPKIKYFLVIYRNRFRPNLSVKRNVIIDHIIN